MKAKLFLIILFLSGCAYNNSSKKITPYIKPKFTLELVPNDEKFTVELKLKSQEKTALCLATEQWPNSQGKVEYSTGSLLIYNNTQYRAKSFNFGYCPGGCGVIEIPALGSLEGFISYAEFGDAAEISHLKDKIFRYSLLPRLCHK
jgi:hypothetical protein